MDTLINYLNAIHPLSDSTNHYLREHLKELSIEKKRFLLKQGHVCQNIYFVSKGLPRCFYVINDKEINSWFMKESDVIISVDSFFNQTQSYENIQALEDCIVYFITYNELQFLYNNFYEFNFVGRILTEKYYQLSEQRLYSLRMRRAVEKYKFLMSYFPQIIQRVPSKHMASYLSVSEETLSRIRAVK